MAGRPDWLLTLFDLLFLAIGVAVIVCFIRQLVLTAGVGPTLVEISDHPLLREGSTSCWYRSRDGSACGPWRSRWFAGRRPTYRQGTNARTEAREVRRLELFRREGFEIRPGEPFQAECGVSVPACASTRSAPSTMKSTGN